MTGLCLCCRFEDILHQRVGAIFFLAIPYIGHGLFIFERFHFRILEDQRFMHEHKNKVSFRVMQWLCSIPAAAFRVGVHPDRIPPVRYPKKSVGPIRSPGQNRFAFRNSFHINWDHWRHHGCPECYKAGNGSFFRRVTSRLLKSVWVF